MTTSRDRGSGPITGGPETVGEVDRPPRSRDLSPVLSLVSDEPRPKHRTNWSTPARWLVADVFDGLATLEDGSVDLVVTSPPFLALRSYLPADHPDKAREIGSEATPSAFLDVMLAFTAELRRVLAPHGSICIELGDTYAGSTMSGGDDRGNERYPNGRSQSADSLSSRSTGSGWPLAKSKTLIPELYRIALAYGINPLTGEVSPAGQWRIRNVVTWARPNPPVGALGDKWRPATSDVVVACTSPKRYWDDLATRKPWSANTAGMGSTIGNYHDDLKAEGVGGGNRASGGVKRDVHGGAPLLDYWEIPLDGSEPTPYGPKAKPTTHRRNAKGVESRENTTPSGQRDGNWSTLPITDENNPGGSPLLDYWVIPPGGYEGSHYAVFPPELVVPLVKAMTPEKVCRECGEPSRRIVSTEYEQTNNGSPGMRCDAARPDGDPTPSSMYNNFNASRIDETVGWTDCGHDNYRPGLVLDPFAGSGTTLLVATGHGHDAIGIDLDARNAELALQRVGPFLLEVVW